MKKLFLTIFLFFGFLILKAQTLSVTTDKNPAIVGEQILIKFTVNAKAKEFKSPNFQGLRILSGPNSSSSSSYSFVNGESKSEITTTYSYYVSASKEGSYTISPASVYANKKNILSNPLTIKVVKGKKQENNNIEKNLFITVSTSKKNIIVGEQIIVSYKLHTRLELENTELSQIPNLNGFWKKDLESSSRFKREVIDGVPYNTAIIKKTVLTAQKSGKLEIDPIKVTCSIRITNQRNRRDPFANFFNSYNVREEIISSKAITINVKDLPSPKPNNFLGSVGNFEISSKIDKKEINANDALTYTIKLTGTGNIELIKPFDINFPKDFEVYDPKVTEKIFQGGIKRSIKTFEYLLIPRYEGEYKIPSYDFSFFDSKQKKYTSKYTKSHNINVLKSKNDEETVTSFNQQKVESINNDINYIKTNTFFADKDNQTIKLNIFYFLFFLPLILMIIVRAIISYKERNPLNTLDKKHSDNIFGFLSIVDGLKVHREDCPNAIELRANYAYRIMKARWTLKENIDFTANLKINGIDSVGLVNKVTQIISKQLNVDIKSININTNDGVFEGKYSLSFLIFNKISVEESTRPFFLLHFNRS